ncbi:MAG: ABC transporter permease [Clostridia bacterium]|nr:ABC transporter permease [Clostridia bacterium]
MIQNPIKEPLVRIVKRDALSSGKAWGIRIASLLLALVLCAVIIFSITKLNPLSVYSTMFRGAFGTARRSWQTIRDAMTLLCISLGLAPAFMMRFWNIGAEGQILVGGIATAGCMIYLGDKLPTPLLFVVMLVACLAAGALWGFIPAFFKAKFGTNETLFTLMMNYIAIQLTSYFVAIWEKPFGSNTVGIINDRTNAGWFQPLFGLQYGWNVAIVLVLTFAMYFYLKHSKQGYEIQVVGESENTARYAGINVSRVIIRTMILSGAVCGLSGFIVVAGAGHTISTSTSGGRGFTAIIVAWLSKFNPFVMVICSFLLTFLDKGAAEIASKFNLNDYVSDILEGIILFFVLGSEFFINYRLIFRQKPSADVNADDPKKEVEAA